ncbi:AAA family ATPase [Actinomadura keratinilytica]|uniref:AAA family ATPase n=1 Tax=Actinomadura keratinilytica TaxID=547461 RepID=UPI00361CBA11
MRLHRLEITAFGPFPGTEHIDFDALSDAGLFLIQGPTGAGKTSILDAVCFALYGRVPGARSRNDATGLRSDHAPRARPRGWCWRPRSGGGGCASPGRPGGSGPSCAAGAPGSSRPRSRWRSSSGAGGRRCPPGWTRPAT